MNAKDIINKPLYALKGSIKIGEVKSLLVDFAQHRVNFLLIERTGTIPEGDFEVNILRFEDLAGKGDYALMITNQTQLRKITNRELFEMLFSDSISIIGLDLYAANRRIGQLVDFSIDPETGAIWNVTALANGTAVSIHVSKDLSYEDGRVYVDPATRLT